MIKNVSNEPVTIKWDGREKVLQPNEKIDVRDLNVAQDQVLLVENKIGSKLTGLVEIVHTKDELITATDLRKQKEALDLREKELDQREDDLNQREAALDNTGSDPDLDIPVTKKKGRK